MRILVIFLSVSIILVVGGLTFFLWQPLPRTFDSKIWKNSARGDITQRNAMYDDLLQKHKLVGMSRSAIYELLGTPDWEGKTDAAWDMGAVGGVDDNRLEIYFEGDKVERYEVVRL